MLDRSGINYKMDNYSTDEVQISIKFRCLDTEFKKICDVLNKETNSVLYKYSSNFRTSMANKLTEFSDPKTLRIITRVKQREEMKILVNQLLEKMAAYPFSHNVKMNLYH